jgi:hypothetical protein
MENREKDNYTVLVDVAESNENKKAKKMTICKNKMENVIVYLLFYH